MYEGYEFVYKNFSAAPRKVSTINRNLCNKQRSMPICERNNYIHTGYNEESVRTVQKLIQFTKVNDHISINIFLIIYTDQQRMKIVT